VTQPLVNAHTHLELSDKSQLLPEPSAEFSRWLTQVIRSNAQRTPETVRAACAFGIAKLQSAGTTHIGDISSTGLSVELLIHSGLQGIVWLEMLATTRDSGLARLETMKSQIHHLRELAAHSPIQIGATLHSTYSIHPSLWDPVLRWVETESLPLCIHAAESPSEWEVLVHGTGPFREFEGQLVASQMSLSPKMKNFMAYLLAILPPQLRKMIAKGGIPYHLPAPMKSPIAYLEQQGALAFKPLLVHAVQVSDEDIQLIKGRGAAVIHCPRSNQRLKCGRMPLEKYLADRVPVLMGTDSLTSSPSLDVTEEATFAYALHEDKVSPPVIEALLRDTVTFMNYCH